MNISTCRRTAIAAVALSAALSVAACSASAPAGSNGGTAGSTSDGGQALPIDQLCGDQPLKIAHVAGFGANSWRKITQAELVDELSACPNVTVEYAQADSDLQKYITAINSYTAKGFDAIITYDDFGSQALNALKNAHDAGVVVVPYIADPGGTVGVDYDGYVQYDFDTEGDTMAKWLNRQVEPGSKLLFSGGLPGGSPSTVALWDGLMETSAELGNAFSPLTNEPQPSNWDAAYEQRAMAGALTKYPEIDSLASDYGVSSKGGLRAFVNAGRPIPPLATSATDNELGCMWLQYHETNPDFQLLTLDGTTTVVRIAARKALAAINGQPDNEPENFKLPTFVDTLNGKLPTCREDLPPDADLSSALSPEQLQAVFQ
ncbi:substrate-binding domain-containing protein [Rhodococcus globerulus]|uniref:substrate-binding domain-containing protein n=1 Tax=Rhodococcus globerulus TaxID=33008 RepID=UPI001C58D3A4|nr:substrate-binding domain-containing protein [Rhodococcus globerulus]QXW01301.1 substrate-binding domain-containing protein [Rhodococcus globerulus]